MQPGAVERHRTALHRTDLSRPIRLALQDQLIAPEARIFDYGCGRGQDVRCLRERGYACSGWDPVFSPGADKEKADVVNLGYVVNVIENDAERVTVLREAWDLSERLLVVAARLADEPRGGGYTPYADGCLSRRGTFQRFFQQQELRHWIDTSLEARSVPAGPGIFYVFRDEGERERFVASRYRRRSAAPRLKKSEILFEQHRALLDPLITFLTERGRLPALAELSLVSAIEQIFGSLARAYAAIRRVTGDDAWQTVREARALDLLVYLALSRFDGRPEFSRLPSELQLDVKAFFSTYAKACAAADELLFAVGNVETVNAACEASDVGKLTPAALYIHHSALGDLGPLLRIYEGCARGYIGTVEGANVIKLGRESPKVAYLCYPEFDRDPHPALAFSTSVNLRTFRIKNRRYTGSSNPPILHRKETFVTDAYPLRPKFARLTQQEERWGLFEDTSKIGTKIGWERALRMKRIKIHGNRLVTLT